MALQIGALTRELSDGGQTALDCAELGHCWPPNVRLRRVGAQRPVGVIPSELYHHFPTIHQQIVAEARHRDVTASMIAAGGTTFGRPSKHIELRGNLDITVGDISTAHLKHFIDFAKGTLKREQIVSWRLDKVDTLLPLTRQWKMHELASILQNVKDAASPSPPAAASGSSDDESQSDTDMDSPDRSPSPEPTVAAACSRSPSPVPVPRGTLAEVFADLAHRSQIFNAMRAVIVALRPVAQSLNHVR